MNYPKHLSGNFPNQLKMFSKIFSFWANSLVFDMNQIQNWFLLCKVPRQCLLERLKSFLLKFSKASTTKGCGPHAVLWHLMCGLWKYHGWSFPFTIHKRGKQEENFILVIYYCVDVTNWCSQSEFCSWGTVSRLITIQELFGASLQIKWWSSTIIFFLQ